MWRRIMGGIFLVVAAWGVPAAQTHADATQHIWLHYDYMAMPDGHSLAPDPRSIQLVVDAFAAHGIDLHIDPQHTVLPYHALLDFDGSVDANDCARLGYGPSDVVDFDALKAQYFHPTANHAWHYAIFGDLSDCTGESGVADLPGSDFVVSLGALLREGLNLVPYFEGGAFMHELGHNLGLHHGGDADENYKPNYLSVMNYSFNFGIPYADRPGSTLVTGLRLDYSEAALPTLDENHLNETRGVGAGTNDITRFYPNTGSEEIGLGPATGPIDWNGNGTATDTDTAVDLDFKLCGLCVFNDRPAYLQLTGFNDWAEIHWYLNQTTHPAPKTVFERAIDDPVVTSLSPTSAYETGGSIVTIHGIHFKNVTFVNFGGWPATSFSVIDDRTLTAVSPRVPSGTGTVDVSVGDANHLSVMGTFDQFTFLPRFTIASITPGSGCVYGGDTVTISGNGFSGATDVLVNAGGAGVADLSDIEYVDDHTITGITPTSGYFGVVPGPVSVDVRVKDSADISAVTPSDRFSYLYPSPQVTSLSPSSGPISGGTTVTIHGVDFTGRSVLVYFGGVPARSASLVDRSTITAVAPSSRPPAGPADVTVVACGITTPISAAAQYTYTVPPPPTVTSVDPSSGAASGGTVLTIHGTGFTDATSVNLGEQQYRGQTAITPAQFTVVDDNTITLATIGTPLGPHTVDVTVSSPEGTSAIVPQDQFTFT